MKEAEKRVRDLEDERQRLDDELKKHVERTRRVNIGQEVLEAKMKVIPKPDSPCKVQPSFCSGEGARV